MSDQQNGGDDGKHEAARRMAEAAIKAEEAGDIDRANALIDQAEKTDPEAVTDVVQEMDLDVPASSAEDDDIPGADAVVPGSDAPSRAGITGSGSGADNQGL